MLVKLNTKKERKKKYEKDILRPRSIFCGGSWFQRIKTLKHKGIYFEVIKTTSTIIVKQKSDGKIGDRNYIYVEGKVNRDSIVKPEELRLRMRIKSHVLKNVDSIDLPELEQKNINYTKIADWVDDLPLGTDIGEMVCFDINMAYYQCALILGFIDESFYNDCIGLPKSTRLRLIGSIATKKRKYCYDKGKIVGEPQILENKKLRTVWLHIVNHVGRCMEECVRLAGDKFVMYWVDGIYLKGKAEDWESMFIEISERWGFRFKTEKIVGCFIEEDVNLKSKRLMIHKEASETVKPKRGDNPKLYPEKRNFIKVKPFYLRKKVDYFNID